jgi:hypothetical protein
MLYNKVMKNLRQNYSFHFKDKAFVWSFFLSFLILIFSLIINFYAGLYATKIASNSVTDIILSNIRVYDVDGIFVYGPWVMWIFVSGLLLLKPYKIPFVLKSVSLFILIRSIFISLTHIGPFPTGVAITSTRMITDFTSGGDLFFSAHTGLPFLLALIFWKHKILRWLFVATSIFFGIVVLLGHLHYSIDVFSAFFITYAIYHIALQFFKKDEQLFHSGHVVDMQ